jgi:hypothetical protein
MTAASPTLVSGLLGADFSWSGVMRTDKLTWLSRGLSLTGFAIAAYLTTVYVQNIAPVCIGGSTGCATVQHSSYAHLAGIPLPVLGLLGYTLLFISACLPGQRAHRGNAVHGPRDCRQRRADLSGAERDPRDLLLVRRFRGLRELSRDRQLDPLRSRRTEARIASRSHGPVTAERCRPLP